MRKDILDAKLLRKEMKVNMKAKASELYGLISSISEEKLLIYSYEELLASMQEDILNTKGIAKGFEKEEKRLFEEIEEKRQSMLLQLQLISGKNR